MKENTKIKQSIIPEFSLGSFTHTVLKQKLQSSKTLNQVQGLFIRNARAFTLIEFLVVVLIIGILTAIALPQYQKAVEKSRGMEAITLLKSLTQAQQTYYLTNGSFANKFRDLDLNLPWTGNTPGYQHPTNSLIQDTRSNKEWSAQILVADTQKVIYITRLTGPYKGAGFAALLELSGRSEDEGKIECFERKKYNISFKGNEGDYCTKLFKATLHPLYTSTWDHRYYVLH